MGVVSQATLLADVKSQLGNDFWAFAQESHVLPPHEYATNAVIYTALDEALQDLTDHAYRVVYAKGVTTPTTLTKDQQLYTLPTIDWTQGRGLFKVEMEDDISTASPLHIDRLIYGWSREQTATATTTVWKLRIPRAYELTYVGRNLWLQYAVGLVMLADSTGASSYELTGVNDEVACRRYLAQRALCHLLRRRIMASKENPSTTTMLMAMRQMAEADAQRYATQAHMAPKALRNMSIVGEELR